ncbi:pyruvate kinase [Anaerosporobacter faecicola]|uniref:pyruvate kinase n=1 Tax=Anaerosporobacter faecicola TaxID=2718714 RepID=UPI00143AD19C|nr:pyruvate kinase [Anaerosporobacter faecicola]
MRKTKIICTMGPSTDQPDIMEALVREGMNVARFNFSHGDYEEHGGRMERLRRIRKEQGKPVAMLLDTKGPEIRLKDFEEKKVFLQTGQTFRLYQEDKVGTSEGVSITYKDLYKDIQIGSHILFDDGLIETQVIGLDGKDIICKIMNDGYISSKKGVNVPDEHLSMPYLSKKDREDILYGIKQQVDFIAASFVRSAEDINQIRTLLAENQGEKINIIAKIENQEGVENIDDIIQVSDGIMIARGDMGVEIPLEEVPVIQKMIIRKVYESGKQVITATQMLDSMMKNPRPTRAETTDVANAIYDGTSAIMLSGETAAGSYPVEALQTMIRIALKTESDIDFRKRFFNKNRKANPDITDAICHATCTTALDLNAKAIVTVTKSGRSARMISRYRPSCNIIGCTTEERVCRQLNLSWGIEPVLLQEKSEVFELFDYAISTTKQQGYLSNGDVIVITSGVPIGKSGTTNMIKVEVV